MLSELARRASLQRQERAGTVVSLGNNRLYTVNVDGATFENVPSTDNSFHRAGESVRIIFRDGKPLVVS